MVSLKAKLFTKSGVLPFLPMLYVAWSDGILTTTESRTILKKLKKQKWISKREKETLVNWLDPKNPPSVTELLTWLRTIRETSAGISEKAKISLADLGIEISRIGASDSQRCTSPETCAALYEIEAALGIVGAEAAQDLLSELRKPKPVPLRPPKASFRISAMSKLLDRDHPQMREKVRKLLSDPFFKYRYELNKEDYREQVLIWCRELAHHGLGSLSFPKAYGGENDLGAFVAAFETIAYHDLSLAIKFGVQFGLFGGSIFNLGTRKHHNKYLRKLGTLELPGCFAMTELGHGSNVRDIETIARYDKKTEEFVIDTPTESARKDYIGNAAMHGQMAAVFAQLEIDDEKYGVHAFLVPIRKADGSKISGVRTDDCGEKMGINGVDNGRLWFDKVRIPRENLLNRFAEVKKDGSYSSPIASASQRFFTMLGTLVGGRVSIAASALSAAKSALTIAIRYASERRQFGSPGKPETLLLDYPIHRRKLLPLLANAYALDFAIKHLTLRYVNRTKKSSREVESLAAGLKSFSTWNTTRTIQVCRESCGGQGYLAENRFADLKADTDVFTTFEGDNTVLLQLVAKGLLTEFRHEFSDTKFFGLVKYIAKQASVALTELNPVVKRITDEAHLRSEEFQMSAFEYRAQHQLVTAARRIKKRLDQGMDSYAAFVDVQHHLINLALAHAEKIILTEFIKGIDTVKDAKLKRLLKRLCDLFALSRIEIDKGWFLESGYIEGVKAKAIRKQVHKLCLELRDDAVALVDAFAIPDECLAAPIAVTGG